MAALAQELRAALEEVRQSPLEALLLSHPGLLLPEQSRALMRAESREERDRIIVDALNGRAG